MNKKVQRLIVAFLGAILLSIIVTAALAPVLASGNNENEPVVTFTGSGGKIGVQLPPGEPSHPTDLQFVVFDFDKRSTFGSFDAIIVTIWVPAFNGYLPAAVVSDSPNTEFFDHAHTVLINTPWWSPMFGFSNIIQVSETELEVDKRRNVVTAELTVPVEISLPFPNFPAPPFNLLEDLSFTLPPFKIEIRGFDSIFRDEESSNLQPSPPLSGYTITQKAINRPAWVRFWSSTWLGLRTQYTSGTLYLHVTRTYTPPST